MVVLSASCLEPCPAALLLQPRCPGAPGRRQGRAVLVLASACGSLSPCPGGRGGTKHTRSVQNSVATRVLNLSWLFTYAFALFV